MLSTVRRAAGHVLIVDCRGKITLASGSDEFRRELNQLLNGDVANVLLNFYELKSFDSSGIGELVSAFKKFKEKGRTLAVIVAPGSTIEEIFLVTKLGTVIPVSTREIDALVKFP